ncbi:MAG: hypothetical protein IJ877_02255, partial [Candidatus Gastranaerophilales bacterium]|nr:hypothetical protein [Candidatus Gastranaerophilales bacterium]
CNSACPTGCSACSGSSTCSSCNAGYYKNGNSCTACSGGKYQPNNSSTATSCSNCSSGYSTNGTSCTGTCYTGCYACTGTSSSACTSCKAGYRKNGNSCTACSNGTYQSTNGSTSTSCTNSTSVTGCSTYSTTTNACTACNTSSGYVLENGTCKLSVKTVTVAGYTWSQYNAGDTNGPKIPSTVTICTAGSSCSGGGITPTCWQGTTSSSCTNTTGYSGCNRTVCNWYAANLICAHNSMSLPSNAAFQALSDSNNTYTGTSTNFCDYNSSSSSSSRCGHVKSCSGTSDGYCLPYNVWGTQIDSSNSYYFDLLGGHLYPYTNGNKQYAYSVRCIK